MVAPPFLQRVLREKNIPSATIYVTPVVYSVEGVVKRGNKHDIAKPSDMYRRTMTGGREI